MTHYKKLVGDRCYLSPCSPEDADKWAEWLNDPEVTIPLGDEAYTTYGLERAREDVSDTVQRGQHVFTIVDLATEAPIGRCLLFAVEPVDRSAMLGIFIGEKAYWGRGYGQEATRLLLDYAFNLLNLNNVMLGAFSFNERALPCYRKVGFKEIGRRREARIVAGRKYDLVLMDLLAHEFAALYGSRLAPQEAR